MEWDDTIGRFTPKADWARTRPQVPLALGRIIVDTLAIYFPFIAGDEAFGEIGPALHDLDQRLEIVNKMHENYLAPKTWPEI